jgi:hypothetical protein
MIAEHSYTAHHITCSKLDLRDIAGGRLDASLW